MRVRHSTSMSTDSPLSRASSLPQGSKVILSGSNNPVLALTLGLIHRCIRPGKQVLHVFVFGGQAGQALADGDAERLAFMVETQLLNLPLQAFSHLQGHLWRTA